MVYSTDHFEAVVLVLVLLFNCFVVYSMRRFVLSLALCYFVLVFFSPFNMVITSLGEVRTNEPILVLFEHLFDLGLFGFVCFRFLFASGMGCGLWLCHSLDFSLTFFFLFFFVNWNMCHGGTFSYILVYLLDFCFRIVLTDDQLLLYQC